MWDYAVVTNVSAERYHEIVHRYEQDGFSLYESNHYRIPAAAHRSLGSAQAESRWDLVMRKASKDISYGQLLINKAYDKLREVRGALAPLVDNPNAAAIGRIGADIDAFLFKGSPEDM